MTRVAAESLRLATVDGVSICARHIPGDRSHAVVVAHGFSGNCHQRRSVAIARMFAVDSGVVSIDFRGHGHSTGLSTVGDLEIHDIEAAVAFAKSRGYGRISVVGFSMGAAVAIRHAAIFGGVSAVAAVSGPAHWYYRGTTSMRMLHHAVERRLGRVVSRVGLRTRISAAGWEQPPAQPWQSAGKIAPAPLLVVHGTADRFFPVRHAYALYEAAESPRALWVEPGMGHAESAMTPDLTARLRHWLGSPETSDVPPTA
ncbi:MAG TPA: alpha/beta fold hydrolase [Candidatus Stackebrandtia excrementipullorum]|nr:alpha/beta fold hydrolase [Candidatus Stackebrandtia excrementipullorum]